MKKSISEVAQRYGVQAQTLRKWEKDFRLIIPRDGEGNRYYTTEQLEILDYITQLKKEGLTKTPILKALDMSDRYKDHQQQAADLTPLEYLTGEQLKAMLESHQTALHGDYTATLTELLQEQEERYRVHIEAMQAEHARKIAEIEERQIKALDELVEAQERMMEKIENDSLSLFARIKNRLF